MDPIVIDALRAAANDSIYPALTRLMGTDHIADCAEVTALDTLLDSLAMDQDTQRQISEILTVLADCVLLALPEGLSGRQIGKRWTVRGRRCRCE